jgi:signal transduction histidine kinase
VGTLLNAVRGERDGAWISDCVFLHIVERRKFEDALLRAKKQAEDAQAIAEAAQRELAAANTSLEDHAEELEALGEQLEAAREAADAANKAKSEFLATMSHELRTPLNAIAGYAQLLEMQIHGPITEAQRDVLGRVERSQQHLLRLINDVLNLARIESGRVEYHMMPMRLAEIVSGIMPMVEPQMVARQLRCVVNVSPLLRARGDPEKTEQIVLNLLSNACKFTPPGGCVYVEGFIGEREERRVGVRVRDTGIGIPADRLQQVFEPFVQVDASNTRGAEGTGLGLAISRDLARGMGGELTVDSALGAGSTFTLALARA